MTTSKAWLLECGNSLTIAAGDHEMAEFVQKQEYFRVPGAPEYCSSVVVWQGKIVPVMDLAALFNPAVGGDPEHSMLCVMKYQSEPSSALQQLAIRVTEAPRKIIVDDEHACELPDILRNSVLGQLNLACFNRDAHPVMIIDIARLCSAEFRELANAA